VLVNLVKILLYFAGHAVCGYANGISTKIEQQINEVFGETE